MLEEERCFDMTNELGAEDDTSLVRRCCLRKRSGAEASQLFTQSSHSADSAGKIIDLTDLFTGQAEDRTRPESNFLVSH